MITLSQACTLRHGSTIHQGTCRFFVGPRGATRLQIMRWRISGMIHLWKTMPERFHLPITYGLKDHWFINEKNSYLFHLEADCPAIKARNEHFAKKEPK